MNAIRNSHFKATSAVPHITALIEYTVIALLSCDQLCASKKSSEIIFLRFATSSGNQRDWNWCSIVYRKDKAAMQSLRT